LTRRRRGGRSSFLRAVPMGGAWLLDHLWRLLGVAEAIGRVARRRRVTGVVERLILCLVSNRALDPMSKLQALEWAQNDTWLPGIGELGSDPQIFYRSMDFLLDCGEEVQREVFFAVADLLNLQVDLLLFDTTSTYFEIPAKREDDLRKFGESKDKRPDLPQVAVGFAVTKEGIPVRCFVYPGNPSDQEIIRDVKDKLREWRLHRVIWVCDTGFNSEENRNYLQRAGGHYIIGEKLRQGTANRSALARPGRYRVVVDGLHVKEVWVGEGETRRRSWSAATSMRLAATGAAASAGLSGSPRIGGDQGQAGRGTHPGRGRADHPPQHEALHQPPQRPARDRPRQGQGRRAPGRQVPHLLFRRRPDRR
jgi:Transposase DDE domain